MYSSTRPGYVTVVGCLYTAKFRLLGTDHGSGGQPLNTGRMRVKILVRGCNLLFLVFYIIKQGLLGAFILRRE